MKRKLLPLAIASVAAFAGVEAAADTTVYGKMNVTYQAIEEENFGATDQDNWEMNSNASRLGVKGSKSLSENSSLKAIYKAEYQIEVDDGNSEFKQRNIYIGLKGDFGSVIAGKNDTPTKMAQGKVDLFNDLPYGDIKNILVGENRQSNILMYTSPNMGGFYANVAIFPGEDSGCDTPACDDDDSGIADEFSVSFNYKADNFNVSFAVDDNVRNTDIIRLAGQGEIGPVKLGALVQQAEVHDDMNMTAGIGKIGGIPGEVGIGIPFEEQEAFVLSASVKAGPKGKVKFQVAQSDSEDFIGEEFEAQQVAVGYDHKLGKKTKAFVYASRLTGENPYLGMIPGADDEVEWTTFGFGMEHKF